MVKVVSRTVFVVEIGHLNLCLIYTRSTQLYPYSVTGYQLSVSYLYPYSTDKLKVRSFIS